MLTPVVTYLKEIAYELIRQVHAGLEDQDIEALRTEGPRLIKDSQANLFSDQHPLKGMSEKEKRLLLAYIVFLRQNVTTESTDNTNDEDTACILHGEVYKGNGKKIKEKMQDELLIQLQKAGLPIVLVSKSDKSKE